MGSQGIDMTQALSLASTGNFEAATRALQRILWAHPHSGAAHYNLAISCQGKRNDLIAINRAVRAHGRPNRDTAYLHFARAKILDDIGDYEAAFAAAEKANSFYADVAFSPELFSRAIDQQIALCDEASLAAPRSHYSEDPRPLFVIGAPRSGTTLLATMLAKHLDITSLGERPDIGMFRSYSGRMPPQEAIPHYRSKFIGDTPISSTSTPQTPCIWVISRGYSLTRK